MKNFFFYQKWSCRQEPHWVSQNQILLKVLKMLLWTLLLHLTWTIMSKLPATNAEPCLVQWLLHCAGTHISLRPKWVWGWPTVYTYPFHTKLYNNLKRVGLAYLTLYQSISFEILSHFDVLDFLPLQGQSVGYWLASLALVIFVKFVGWTSDLTNNSPEGEKLQLWKFACCQL